MKATKDSAREREVFGGERMVPAPEEEGRGVMWAVREPRRAEPTPEEARGVDGKVRLGKCFEQAGRYAMDHAGARVVHGVVRVGQAKSEDGRGVPIDHAWVELRGGAVVYDGVQGAFYDGPDYREKMAAEAGRTYSREEAAAEMLRTEHFGPWADAGQRAVRG